MEIRTLKTFIEVAEVGTISHASKRLHCVQSNVTSRIKSLEDELGVTLFQRSRKGMALTAAGLFFLPHAQAVLDTETMAIASIKNFSNSVKLLRIGSMESTLAIRLPSYIATFRSIYPKVRLGVSSGPTEDLVQQVLDNRIDIAFIGGQFRNPELEGRVAFSEEMVLATDQSIVNIEQAGASPLIVFKPGCTYRSYSQNWMKKTGLAPNEVLELGTLDGILGCVASGVGITLLPRSVVESSRHRRLLIVHDLSDEDRFIDTIAISNTKAPPNGAIEAFIDLVCRARTDVKVLNPAFSQTLQV